MTTTRPHIDAYDAQLDPNTLAELQRRAHDYKYSARLPWVEVARLLDEPEPIVRRWAQDYIARTDEARDREQMPLFDLATED